MYRFLIFIVLSSIFFSCEENKDNRVEGKTICVYFDKKSDLETAKKFADFWKKNGFLNDKKQFIRLAHKDKTFYIHLITKDLAYVKNLSFEDKKLLIDLQKRIDSILPLNQNCNFVLSNSNFEPILNVND